MIYLILALNKIKIRKICSNDYIAHALTDAGSVYSWGSDLNKSGVLAMGNTYIQDQPILNTRFQKMKIINISISGKHGAAIESSLIYLYSKS